MDLGFSPDLAAVAGASSALAAMLSKLAGLRRRMDRDLDGAPDDGPPAGSAYVHPDVQPALVVVVMLLLGWAFAALAGQPLFPVLSAVWSGLGAAVVVGGGVKAVRG